MKFQFSFIFLLLFSFTLIAQDDAMELTELPDDLPYYEIPEEPKEMNAEGMVARMIDGLGYRYFWATEDLREEDLAFKAGETNRTTEETINHVYNLSKTILNGVAARPNVRGYNPDNDKMDFAQKRKATLENFKTASDLLREKSADVNEMKIIFQRGDKKSEFSFWKMINGPIADAIWHAGQIVSNRRASGNPLHPGVNVFMGKTKF